MKSLAERVMLQRADEQMEQFDFAAKPNNNSMTGHRCVCGAPLSSLNVSGVCWHCYQHRSRKQRPSRASTADTKR